MAGFQQGRITRVRSLRQSKKLIEAIKEIYSDLMGKQSGWYTFCESLYLFGAKIGTILLDFHRNNRPFAVRRFAIVHSHLLLSPCTGKLVSSDQDEMIGVDH